MPALPADPLILHGNNLDDNRGYQALRAAKERTAQEVATAKQSLHQLMTLRQEAEMVLSGLLD